MSKDRITERDAFDIRYTDLADEGDLKRWLLDPSLLFWFPMDTPKEVEIMANNWIGFARYKCSLTAVFEGRPVGLATLFLMPYRKIAHLAVIYIAVDPEMTGLGITTSLIKNIKNLGKNYFRLKSVHLEIMEDSHLKDILINQGFEQIIRQEDFYRREGEKVARIVMEAML